MANNGFQNSFQNDRPPSSTGSGDAADLTTDPASSSFFSNDYKKHEDLKQMLDSNKDNLKLEAMKRIIGMVAKGKDASDLFPAVVKNVVSKNIEVKKLVYVYLTRYAEEQQDLALLSISTFQRALKDPNQLIRASALRVLSSIRVPIIVPIMMLAIKEAVMDMSPYVRKTAAHAIPKLYSLEPDEKDVLIEVIEKLLADKTTLVAGSAIQAFEEVCPERIDLVHKNFRKLCNLLVDVEEWGQVVIINMLTRYARSQFINPNAEDRGVADEDREFYESSGGEETETKKTYMMDPDHRLLLRTSKPLLNSRNAAVVMSVAQLYHHCAPQSEVMLVAKALVRLLRGHKEIQYMVLFNVVSMSVKRKSMFEAYLKSFFVRSCDPTHVKLLKLEILTNLATETNVSTILREFQTYVTSSDKQFAAATIQAIGRCASNISEITDTCLNGLVALLSNRDETVVGESVVIIKKLLQMQPTQHKDIIWHMAKLADTITVPMARASILWLIGEYSDRVPKIAPDVLRKMAKTFIDEADIVKLQILNLAGKLCITNPKQTRVLCQYVFNLAKYDQNYDIRDRTRFLRQLVLPSGEQTSVLAKHAKKIFLSTKPAPVLESRFKDREHYQLGSLSHMINNKAHGYQQLPDWPEVAPDPSVRNVEVEVAWTSSRSTSKKSKPERKKSFYSSTSEDDTSGGSTSETDSDEETSSDSDLDSSEDDSSDGSGSESDTESSESDVPVKPRQKSAPPAKSEKERKSEMKKVDSESGSESESESESDESDSDESESEPEKPVKKPAKKPVVKETKQKSAPDKKSVDNSPMLLDLDDFGPAVLSAPVMSASDLLTPATSASQRTSPTPAKPNYNLMSPVHSPSTSYELLNRMAGRGLSCTYRFTRTVSIFSPKMISLELTFTNHSDNKLTAIQLTEKKLQPGMEIQEFPEISSLAPGSSASVLMAVDFNDTTQPAKFTIHTSASLSAVSINAPVGELLQPNTLTEADFLSKQKKLSGMNENVGSVDKSYDPDVTCKVIYEAGNVGQVRASQEDMLLFAARTASTSCDVLVAVKSTASKTTVTVNCEKMVIGSMLLKEIKSKLSKM